jgi:8-oxo-dGTP pyrophosphatase MutT (NUDIX family)
MPEAGVVILTRKDDFGNPEILMVKQKNDLLCFPGGKREEYDKTIMDCAKREFLEEVGYPLPDTFFIETKQNVSDWNVTLFLGQTNQKIIYNKYPIKNNETVDMFWVNLDYIRNKVNKNKNNIKKIYFEVNNDDNKESLLLRSVSALSFRMLESKKLIGIFYQNIIIDKIEEDKIKEKKNNKKSYETEIEYYINCGYGCGC